MTGNRRPLLRSITTTSRSEAVSNHGKNYVVFRDGLTFAGDPIARQVCAFATYCEADVHAQVLCREHGRCWVEEHSGGLTRSTVLIGWRWVDGEMVRDREAGPTREQL